MRKIKSVTRQDFATLSYILILLLQPSELGVLGLPKQSFLSASDPKLPRCFPRSSKCTTEGVEILAQQGVCKVQTVSYSKGLIITCIKITWLPVKSRDSVSTNLQKIQNWVLGPAREKESSLKIILFYFFNGGPLSVFQ